MFDLIVIIIAFIFCVLLSIGIVEGYRLLRNDISKYKKDKE